MPVRKAGSGRRKPADKRLSLTEPADDFEAQVMAELDKKYFGSLGLKKVAEFLEAKRDAWADYLWPHKPININWPLIILFVTAAVIWWMTTHS